MGRRVFILDYESISPLGVGRQELLASLRARRLAGKKVERFRTDGLPVTVAAEVNDDLGKLLAFVDDCMVEAIRFDRKLELLIACYSLMRRRLRQVTDELPTSRKGVVLGVGIDVFDLNTSRTSSPIEETSTTLALSPRSSGPWPRGTTASD